MRLRLLVLSICFAAVAGGCQSVPASPQPSPSPTPSPSSQLIATYPRERVIFNRVIDGDTIEVSTNGAKITVRIIGINTPETVDPRRDVECFGLEASNFAKNYFKPGTELQLEADASQTNQDRYGRLLRYVFIDNEADYGQAAIVNGYANEYTYDTAYRYQEAYRQAEQQARENKLGLWADDACNTPSPSPSPSSSVKSVPLVKPSPTVQGTSTGGSSSWTCNCGKTCPNMTCAEAQYQLNTCGCSRRDGDNDGVACDAQCS